MSGQIIRYLLMTGLSAVVTLGFPVFFHEIIGIPKDIAVGLALVIALLINFLTIKYFVFKDTNKSKNQFINFFLSSLAFRFIEYIGYFVLHNYLDIFYISALLIVLLASIIAKFFYYKFFIFSDTK